MEVNGVLPISAQPVQEGQEVTRPNREGGDAVAFAALLYLILGTPQAGISSAEPEGMKAGETEASASGAMPIGKGSGALIANSGLDSSTRASAWAEGSGSGFSPSGVPESVTRLPGGGQAGLSVGIHGAFTNGSTPKSAAVAVEIDTSIVGGRVDPGAVSEINRDPIEALTAQASAAGQESTVPNDGTSLTREPAAGAPIRVAADDVETDPQVEPDRTFAKFALAEGSVIRRGFAVNVEPFDPAQGRPESGEIEQPTTTSATGQIVASGNLSNHVEPELMTGPAGKNHPDLRTGGQFELDITANGPARLPGRGQAIDSQATPAQGHERQALTASTIGRDSAINIEPFDQAQGRHGTWNIEREGTGGSVGRDYAINTEEPRTWNVERPTTTESTGQVAASGNLSNQVEPELVTEPAGKNRLDLRSGRQFKLDITASAAGRDSQAHPAQDSEKLAPGTSTPNRLIHEAGTNSIRAEVDPVAAPAGEIDAGAELTGKFQFGKTADGGVAEQDAKLMAEADAKTDAPGAGRGPAQRLSDIAAPVPRPDIAAEKFGPAGDPAPASWRSTVNRVADELASHVRLNKREAVIQLDPPELGKIKIEMRLNGDKLEARIVAEVHESRALIESHLPELRQALRLQHLDLADVRVSQDGWSGGSGDPMQGFRQQQPDGEPQWARNSETSAAAASASPERSGSGDSGGEKGRVSVWV